MSNKKVSHYSNSNSVQGPITDLLPDGANQDVEDHFKKEMDLDNESYDGEVFESPKNKK
jgi:hypothetical protein